MKMHMKTIHAPKPKRISKRLPNFTPLAKPSKRTKSEEHFNMNLLLNTEGIIDEDNSILIIDDTFSGNQTSLEENTASIKPMDTSEEKVKNDDLETPVHMKPLFSCTKCEYDCESDGNLESHLLEVHTATECTNCTFISGEDIVLKDHESDCNALKQHHLKNKISTNNEDVNETENIEEDSAVICGVCNDVFKSISECEQHMKSHPSKCYMCEFKSDDVSVLNRHEKEHMYQKCKPDSHQGKCKKVSVDKNEYKCEQYARKTK